MVKLGAIISTLAVTAAAVVVQGASLEARACSAPTVKCETSGGSPLVSDCQAAVNQLKEKSSDSDYEQYNGSHSHCTTIKKVGKCKVDVCGEKKSWLFQGSVKGPAYLQQLLNTCPSGSVVGGQISPPDCWTFYPKDTKVTDSNRYRLQFSHA